MQDTLINMGRGIDGMIGRMVDRFGDRPSAPTSAAAPAVALVRFIVVNIAEGHERVLHVDETLVAEGVSRPDLQRQLLAPYAEHVDRHNLRVHTRLLRSWPRLQPNPAVQAPPVAPTADAPSAAPRTAEKAKPKTSRTAHRHTDAAAPATAEAPTETAAAPDDQDQRLLSALAEANESGLSMAQLVKQLGERSAALRVRLQRLGRDGAVRRAGDGLKTRYRVTDPRKQR